MKFRQNLGGEVAAVRAEFKALKDQFAEVNFDSESSWLFFATCAASSFHLWGCLATVDQVHPTLVVHGFHRNSRGAML